MPTDKRPNLFLVGAQKSGTSALAGWLTQHPRVFMSFPKEPGFLAFGERGYPYRDGYGRAAPASRYVVTDARAYERLFEPATALQTLRGEASTWYFALPGMAARIRDYNPAARIVVILRDPVQRAYSAWCHARRDDLEPCENFAEALAKETERGEVEFLLRYRRMGLYSAALAEYQSVFPAAQLLLLFHQDLHDDPAGLWRRLCGFLAIDAAHEPDFAQRFNRSGQPRSRVLHRLVYSHRAKRMLRAVLPYRLAVGLKQRADALTLARFPPLDAASAAQLRDYYRADIERLGELAHRDLRAWLVQAPA